MHGLMEGVELCASAIRPTYGGAGTNVVVESRLRPYHMVVNDAEAIIQALDVKEDPAKKIGVNLIKELCSKQDRTAGNGRKTAVIIAAEILKGAASSSSSKLQLKRGLDALIPFVEKEIDKRTTRITVDDVAEVAATAAESEETGRLLQEIYQQIGTNGILNIEGSKTYETSYKVTNGVRFEFTGMLSPSMAHDEEAKREGRREVRAVYENPIILVTKKKIDSDEDINPLLREMRNTDKRDLVIFTNDMDSKVASDLVALHKSGDFHILIVKAPSLWQDYVFEDFARCVGATVVQDSTGVTFKSLNSGHLGTCGRLECDQEEVILTGICDLTEHMGALAAKGDDDSLLRLSWLASKSAVLKLGANSETDLSYKRLKANDANRSAYLALQHGVVEGGGLCLAKVADYLPATEAGLILAKALIAPAEQARSNYGIDIDDYAKLITTGIIDASQTIKMAVRNAVGIASTVLTASGIVYIPERTAAEIAAEAAARGANPFSQ